MLAIAAALLASQAAPATAAHDWWYLSLIADDPADMAAVYADLASRRQTGDLVTINEAMELQHVNRRGYISSRTTINYDCRARTAQIIDATFLDPEGRVTETMHGDPAPHGVEPDSAYEATMAYACGRGEGLEQLGRLTLREHAPLLFQAYLDHLAAQSRQRH